MPNNCLLLVDTFDSLNGVRKAVAVGKKLREQGKEMLGIRLDSGDLAFLSIEARRIETKLRQRPNYVSQPAIHRESALIRILAKEQMKYGFFPRGSGLPVTIRHGELIKVGQKPKRVFVQLFEGVHAGPRLPGRELTASLGAATRVIKRRLFMPLSNETAKRASDREQRSEERLHLYSPTWASAFRFRRKRPKVGKNLSAVWLGDDNLRDPQLANIFGRRPVSPGLHEGSTS